MEYKLNVTAAPHVRSVEGTSSIMNDVFIALIPACIFAIYNFGLYALAIIAVSVIFAVASEYFWQYFTGKQILIRDGSAFLTGLLLALNMPPTIPLWIPALGSIIAVILIKQLFGGIGKNYVNPALGARVILMFAFMAKMNSFAVDAYTGATPLTALKRGTAVDPASVIMGFSSGCIGEVSVIALLIGAAYLLIKRVISWEIPVMYILSFAVFAAVFGGHGLDPAYLVTQICGGGLILGAFFMATDYVTSPITLDGKIIFGILLGVITGMFRFFSSYAEGVSFAIVIGNLLVPVINKVTIDGRLKRRKAYEA